MIEITTCARPLIPGSVWDMLRWVLRYTELGIPPLAGGGLDQTKSFLDALDFFEAEISYWNTKLGIKRHA